MEIRHCPSCGSDEIDVSSFSAEYMRSTTYSCEDCDWYYKKGSGIGTGSGNSGIHPRDAGTASPGQTKLVEAGSWCNTCEVCAKSGHCGCVEEQQTGFCEECAKYAEQDRDEMLEVQTYFGRHKRSPFTCDICGDNKAELKLLP